MSALLAVLSLLGSLALLLVPGGVLFVPFTLGLFLLALTGVLGGLENRTVASTTRLRGPTAHVLPRGVHREPPAPRRFGLWWCRRVDRTCRPI